MPAGEREGVAMLKPQPRTQNVFLSDSRPLVAKVPHCNGDYLPASVRTALQLLGGLEKAIGSGDRVMLKPNFNCSYALPLSTDLGFLAAAIEVLQDAGAKVRVGEMSGRSDWPTDKVVRNLEVLPVLRRYGVDLVNFEHDEWIPLQVQGRYWQSFRVPRSMYEADKRVYLANMRCHSTARFSASLKLGVGWIDLQDRDFLHSDPGAVEAKVAELHLGWQPELVLMDGRRSTVTWHGRGAYVYPNVIMASGDMVAIDTEAVKTLREYPEDNGLDVPLGEMAQLRIAREHRLGSVDYTVLEAPAHSHTEQEGIPRAWPGGSRRPDEAHAAPKQTEAWGPQAICANQLDH